MKIKLLLTAILTIALTAGIMPVTSFAWSNDIPSAIKETTATEEQEISETDTAIFPAKGTITIDLDSLFDRLFSKGSDTKISFNGQEWDMTECIESFFGSVLTNNSEKPLFGKIVTDGSCLNLRSGSGTDFPIIGQLSSGDEVKVLGKENDWYKIEVTQKTGYICGEYLNITETDQKAAAENMHPFDEEFFKLLFTLMLQKIEERPETGQEMELTPNGNLTLVDDMNPVNTQGKQFITMVTKAGNYFYLVIDRDDKGNENVHFLNMVDETDLLALMDEDEAAKHMAQTAEVPENQKLETETAEPPEMENPEKISEDKRKENKKSSRKIMPVLLIAFLVTAGGGVFFIQNRKKKKEQEKPDPDADYLALNDEEDEIILPDDVSLESESNDNIVEDNPGYDDMEPL